MFNLSCGGQLQTKKMKRRTVIILVIVILIGIGGLAVYKMLDEKDPSPSKDKADFVINATDLIAAFDQDTASASRMYVDKLIEVTVQSRNLDTTGSVVLGEPGSDIGSNGQP